MNKLFLNKAILFIAAIGLTLSVGYLTLKTHKNKMPEKINREGEIVILLHGLLRGSGAMSSIEKYFSSMGYKVYNFEYPSRQGISKSAKLLDDKIKYLRQPNEKIHFVTHSLGAIVLRSYLDQFKPANIGRIVMIAPPNKCSSLALKLKELTLYRIIFGDAGQEVACGEGSIPKKLPAPKAEIGIITGGTGSASGLNPFLAGDNDGTVTVEETKVAGMKDFIQINGQHSLLLMQSDVIENSAFFIETGRFKRSD